MSQEKNEKLGFSKKSSGVVLKDVTKIFQQPDTGKDFVAAPSPAGCPGRTMTPPRASNSWRKVFPAPCPRLSRRLPGEKS